MSRLLVFATLGEALPSLQSCEAKAVGEGLYEIPEGLLLVTGMGCVRAASRTAAVLERYPVDEVWNVGVAGSYCDDRRQDMVYPIASVEKNLSFPAAIDDHSQRLARAAFPRLELQAEGLNLLTSDYPLHARGLQGFDLVDMEGYGVAFAAQEKGVACALWKIVSDFTNARGPKQIESELALRAAYLAQWLVEQCVKR